MEECGRKLSELQIKYQDLQETNLKDQQVWLVEKNELVRQMTEQRQRLMKDNRKIEDVLHQVRRFMKSTGPVTPYQTVMRKIEQVIQ